MGQTDIFKLIRSGELFTNEAIIRWMKSFDYNIGISPVLVLTELKLRGTQKHTTLSKKLGYSPGAITSIADRLIKLGLAERKYNENDRRNVFLSITDKGLEVQQQAIQKGRELHVELFKVLSEEEVQQLINIYAKLLKNFDHNEE
ncbi:MarR family winged helix-turn-helix transcriptional regulator [Paenibacillus macquariensis]|uniref:DNA-binding transcriptional regulator, MarR family n=1 Tax=Paenibacillus macquariensis TaxID=948756 RepID=A0ABY1K4I5_9BACL|nr:MarR family transcriptional regulator [Paenibacillus macquariensis]MEC0089015.1 MarR family transcriptional regulator [Paenibacillus macquariensis]OAB31850.1 MarR family transcriptional regulator [Paenibacillus macquariensis subsp. macquariensis]SIR24496.1 DNA-binding transcriptional regulator, MarR family [Paenibacillus macquariensis]